MATGEEEGGQVFVPIGACNFNLTLQRRRGLAGQINIGAFGAPPPGPQVKINPVG